MRISDDELPALCDISKKNELTVRLLAEDLRDARAVIRQIAANAQRHAADCALRLIGGGPNCTCALAPYLIRVTCRCGHTDIEHDSYTQCRSCTCEQFDQPCACCDGKGKHDGHTCEVCFGNGRAPDPD